MPFEGTFFVRIFGQSLKKFRGFYLDKPSVEWRQIDILQKYDGKTKRHIDLEYEN